MMNVVVLGAGYAGLVVARRLEGWLPDDVELLVIDESGEHVVRHELHRLIRRPDLEMDLTIPLEDVLEDARIRQARVESVKPAENRVILADGEAVEYDYAAVCLGSETEFYDLPGVEEYAAPLKQVEDAHRIRLGARPVIETGGRIVIGGAGLSGIQVAGELAVIMDETDATDTVEIMLLEQVSSVAPGFPRNFQRAVHEELEACDIEIRTGTVVTGATEDRIKTEDGSIGYDQFIWTGGIRGPTAIGGERYEVNGTLKLGDGTFVIGDAARVIDRDGELVPATAQAAIREARVAARNIRRLVEYESTGNDVFEPQLEVLKFVPRGWIVSVGDRAVAQVGPTVVRGMPALALKKTIGLGYLTSMGAVREAVDFVVDEFGVRRSEEVSRPK